MTKRLRRKFEMFLRVRDFFNARKADFPAESVGGGLFAALLLIIQRLEQLSADKFSVIGDVAQAIDIKGDAKDLLNDLLQDNADMATTMAYEFNGFEHKFRMPRNKGVPSLIAAGRAFAADAAQYRADFVRYGLEPDFIGALTAATDALEAAYSDTDDSTQERVGTNAALAPLFKDGTEKIKRLDPIIKIKYRNDAANLSAWIYASHVAREPQPAQKPEPAV
jgi:hypothetical protein